MKLQLPCNPCLQTRKATPSLNPNGHIETQTPLLQTPTSNSKPPKLNFKTHTPGVPVLARSRLFNGRFCMVAVLWGLIVPLQTYMSANNVFVWQTM